MSEELIRPALDLYAEGNLEGAVEMLDGLRQKHAGEAVVHHTYAELANILNMEAQDDVVPGMKIMLAYKKAMELRRFRLGMQPHPPSRQGIFTLRHAAGDGRHSVR